MAVKKSFEVDIVLQNSKMALSSAIIQGWAQNDILNSLLITLKLSVILTNHLAGTAFSKSTHIFMNL